MANYSNPNNDSIVTGTASADYIYNSANRVTVYAGGGNDTISNLG